MTGTLALDAIPLVLVEIRTTFVALVARDHGQGFEINPFCEEPPIAVLLGAKKVRIPLGHRMIGCNDKARVAVMIVCIYEGSPGSLSEFGSDVVLV